MARPKQNITDSNDGTMSGKCVGTAAARYRGARQAHWDDVARKLDNWKGWAGHYHRRLAQVYQFLVAPGQRVLELGCGQGDLLAALDPTVGVGVDFSIDMVERARRRHPNLRFIHTDAHE